MGCSVPAPEIKIYTKYKRFRSPDKPVARLGKGWISELAYSPDGKLLAVGGSLGIWLYDANNLTEVGLLKARGVRLVAFNPKNGKMLASGGYDGKVRLWDITEKKELYYSGDYRGGRRNVTFVAFSSNGKTLAAAIAMPVRYTKGSSGRTGPYIRFDDTAIDWWKVEEDRLSAGGRLNFPREQIRTVALSPDGKMLALTGFDRTPNKIHLWDIEEEKEITVLDEGEGHNRVRRGSLAFSPDRKTLASVDSHWEVKERLVRNIVHTSTRLKEEVIRLWDIAEKREVAVLRGHTGEVKSLAFSPDARRVAVGHPFGVIRIYDLTTSNMLSSFEVSAETSLHSPSTIAFDPTGSTVAIGCALSESTLRVLGMLAGGEIQLSGHGNVRIPQETTRCQIQLRDAQSGKVIRLLSAHQHAVTAVTFSDNGRLFASAGSDRMIRVWDVETEQLIEEVETDFDSARHLAFSPDGTTLASGEGKHPLWGRIVLWDIESGQKRIL